MARLDDLIPFARRHGLKIGTIADLIAYRHRNDRLVECVSDEPFESDYGGDWRLKSYRNKTDGSVNLVLQKGAVDPQGVTLVRMHAVSLFDDLMGRPGPKKRSEEHTSELQSLMRNSYAVFCLKKNTYTTQLIKPKTHDLRAFLVTH